jgi:hypothetical protein
MHKRGGGWNLVSSIFMEGMWQMLTSSSNLHQRNLHICKRKSEVMESLDAFLKISGPGLEHTFVPFKPNPFLAVNFKFIFSHSRSEYNNIRIKRLANDFL